MVTKKVLEEYSSTNSHKRFESPAPLIALPYNWYMVIMLVAESMRL